MKAAGDAFTNTELGAWKEYVNKANRIDAAYTYATSAIASNPNFDGVGYLANVIDNGNNSGYGPVAMGGGNGVSPAPEGGWIQTPWEMGKAAFWGAVSGAKNLGIGVASTAKQAALYVTDVVCVEADNAVTRAGIIVGKNWSLGYEEMSSVGISNKPTNPDFVPTALWNAGRTGLGAGTLGVSEISAGVYQFSQDGNADALSQHMGGVAFGNLSAAGFMRFKGIDYNIGPKLNLTEITATIKPKSFVEQMTPDEATRYREYWQNNAPKNAPGVQRLDWFKLDKGRMESSRVIYDEYGRQTYRVDFTDHSRPLNHTNPHLHEYIYEPGRIGQGILHNLIWGE